MKIFYQRNVIQAVLQPDRTVTLLRAQGAPMAEYGSASARSPSLVLGCDQQGSPMNVMSVKESHIASYTPYGLEKTLQSVTGFTGQLKAWNLPGYFLGNGYRFFNTVLMRFHSPDTLSPFAEGGNNSYMYCGGDPVNQSDPSGHVRVPGHPGSPPINRRYVGSTFNLLNVAPESFEPWLHPDKYPVAPASQSLSAPTSRKRPMSGGSSPAQGEGRTSPDHGPLAKQPKLSVGNSSKTEYLFTQRARQVGWNAFNEWNESSAYTVAGRNVPESKFIRKVAFDAMIRGNDVYANLLDRTSLCHQYDFQNVSTALSNWLARETAKGVRSENT